MCKLGRFAWIPVTIAALAAWASASAENYDVRVFHDTPTTDELIDSLESPKGAPDATAPFTFRGARPVQATKPKAVSLKIQFGFNSSELTPEAKEVLDHLGTALQSERLHGDRFLIEGRTDSIGSARYNQALSEQRAQNVKSYLVSNFQIDPSRVRAVGRGKSDPLDKDHPQSGINRRVQVVNLRWA